MTHTDYAICLDSYALTQYELGIYLQLAEDYRTKFHQEQERILNQMEKEKIAGNKDADSR